ncbi:hypothetical protein HMPREF0971_02855 [Segatella oris F0302]|uniref:Uncharacterized protein n=1 Tax=Segatella oris F0302 TaxID=649760 RepID=D1QV18_9BACT|nr:hypothetical protein HMPREF0971_02855 [Segatella oris F0302]
MKSNAKRWRGCEKKAFSSSISWGKNLKNPSEKHAICHQRDFFFGYFGGLNQPFRGFICPCWPE